MENREWDKMAFAHWKLVCTLGNWPFYTNIDASTQRRSVENGIVRLTSILGLIFQNIASIWEEVWWCSFEV